MPRSIQNRQIIPLRLDEFRRNVNGHAALPLALVLVGEPRQCEGGFADCGGGLLEFLELALGDVVEGEEESAGEGGFSGVDVAEDD